MSWVDVIMPSQFKTAEERHKVLPGYPKKFIFSDLPALRKYLSGDKITCLLCGKQYKSLGAHLAQLHKMKVDDYKEMYGIPWTNSLAGNATKRNYGKHVKKRIADGEMPWVGPKDTSRLHTTKHRKSPPIRSEIDKDNIKDYVPTRSPESIAKQAAVAKKGTPEFREKMRNRPQVKAFKPDNRKGIKQSPEHIRKRVNAGLKTKGYKTTI